MTRKPPPEPTLADQARELQRLAPVGSTRRKAAGILAVLADNTRSTAGARRLLERHRIPPEIRQAATQLLTELTTSTGDDTHA